MPVRHIETPELDVFNDAKTEADARLAPLFWVVMHNDPVTTMDFVVMILMKVFAIDYEKSVQMMFNIHNSGLDYIDLMPFERAEFKVEQVYKVARAQSYPLTCTIEPGE